jgi:hypothetical protein
VGLALAVDTGASTVIPTITISDVEAERSASQKAQAEASSPSEPQQVVPGTLSDDPAPTIPDWYKVGWRAVGGLDDVATAGEARDKSILASFVDEQYYGAWYHNAALIFFVSRTICGLGTH